MGGGLSSLCVVTLLSGKRDNGWKTILGGVDKCTVLLELIDLLLSNQMDHLKILPLSFSRFVGSLIIRLDNAEVIVKLGLATYV